MFEFVSGSSWVGEQVEGHCEGSKEYIFSGGYDIRNSNFGPASIVVNQ